MAYNKETNAALDRIEEVILNKYAWTGTHSIDDLREYLYECGRDEDLKQIMNAWEAVVEVLNN